MIPRRNEINLQLQQIADVAILAVALWIAHEFRWRGTVWFNLERGVPPFGAYAWTLIALLPFAPLILDWQGYYQSPLGKTWFRALGQVVRSLLLLGGLVAVCVIFLRLSPPPRTVLLVFAALAAGLLVVKDRLTALWLKRRAQAQGLKERVLLAGSPQDMDAFLESAPRDQSMMWEIAGRIDIERQPVSELVDALHSHNVSLVIFAAGHTQLKTVEAAVNACEVEGVEAWLLADFIKTSIARPTIDSFGGRLMIAFRSTPDLSWSLLIKEIMDRVGGAILLLAASPLLVLAAVGIKLTSPGPILFKQMRSGRHGRPFLMYKFRTMTSDAEMRKAELEQMNQMSGPVFKIENDPRITPFGAWLRRTSIDELPQLWNVLTGEMSLVGPRPLPIYETEKFEDMAHRRRLSMKPGLTCLWQVGGRNRVRDFQDWVKLDLEYIDNWSLWLDLRILLKTVPAVLLGFGAR